MSIVNDDPKPSSSVGAAYPNMPLLRSPKENNTGTSYECSVSDGTLRTITFNIRFPAPFVRSYFFALVVTSVGGV